ncbi:glycerol-3-phosphate dehydrogenase [Pinisolibacter aquiterrae]|uniref:glycerol-3-phosphate dehydrogenase n=1 Tax=Pinisolibacter aquiterrae TaxID=2815579 RepID=UPI001C3CFE57|nr:glycerol-3-phosphate dehydrogenase [Pinisolibacter aquiterrae]MBV5265828.1 glycerol-3-phosphate dehydrogenase [Pinisolibacter aquiterrae]MCC8236607.1 glycerol-3-phosphate dehydrogenase [Pinisolibacter aquiterrae]
METIYDLAVIGGGINGCGIARDAAGRGLSVHLCEMNDLASGTSSWSTKLVHGGLRYLEYYEFRLVHEALVEREVLWRAAPHLIEPLRFVLPHHAGLRPAWFLRLGLFVYDHLGGRKLLPGTRTLDLTRDPAGAPLKPGLFRRGFEYSDCRVDDARLVVLTALDAAERGAVIETRTRAVAATGSAEGWTVTLEDRDGARRTIRARALVNAAGPWVERILTEVVPGRSRARVRLVQGSHVVVRRLYDHDRCYLFQNGDGRIVFAIPYERDFTLIGTTDQDFHGDPGEVRASEAEIDYLCRAASDYFARPIGRDDVVWSFSGVRPLYDDGASEAKAASRDYVFELDESVAGAPLLSIFGGKITTYRRLAEAALRKLATHLPAAGPAWTATAPLPGGDFPVDGRERLAADLLARHPFLDAETAARLVRAYGTRAEAILGSVTHREDLGRDFGAGLSEAEVRHMMSREWAVEADDVLWRRSKLGLRLSPDRVAELAAFMAAARR